MISWPHFKIVKHHIYPLTETVNFSLGEDVKKSYVYFLKHFLVPVKNITFQQTIERGAIKCISKPFNKSY